MDRVVPVVDRVPQFGEGSDIDKAVGMPEIGRTLEVEAVGSKLLREISFRETLIPLPLVVQVSSHSDIHSHSQEEATPSAPTTRQWVLNPQPPQILCCKCSKEEV